MEPDKNYVVADFMSKTLITAKLDTPISECAAIMKTENIGSLLIVSDGEFRGIVTERDISRDVVAEDLDPDIVHAKDIMTSNLITADPDTTLYDAMVLLGTNKIKHLPVVRDNKILGIITAMDILRVEPSYIEVLYAPEVKGEVAAEFR